MATAKQIAWRKKFAEMAKSGALKKKKRAKNPAKKTTVAKAPARKTLAKAPAKRKTNPSRTSYAKGKYIVFKSTTGNLWSEIAAFMTKADATQYAKAYAKANPNHYVRVISK